MKKILVDAILIFLGFVIGLLISNNIGGEPLFSSNHLPYVILGLIPTSIIASLLKYYFIDVECYY